jgi:hypothetical protein
MFRLPLSKALGIKKPVACEKDMRFIAEIFANNYDWKISMSVWIFMLRFLFSAANRPPEQPWRWINTGGDEIR